MSKRFFILCFGLLTLAGTSHAHDLEPLHVDGRYLKNPKGDIVTLHGYLTVVHPAFQPEDFGEWHDYDMEAAFLKKKASLDSVLATGWKMDYVRFKLDDYWCVSKETSDGEEHESFDFARFKYYFENLFLPLIDYYHEKGLYTLLWPPSSTPDRIEIGDDFQQHMLLIWDYVSSHPRIAGNPGVMFELANEPIGVTCQQGKASTEWFDEYTELLWWCKEGRDFWQPVVDIIRSHCDNIVYIPGFYWQTGFAGFVDYPIKGDNIGYAVHRYPGEVYEWADEEFFPVANTAPFIMTENAWGRGGYLQLGDQPFTSNFGKPLKEIIDEVGNVSWNCYEPAEDYYYLVNNTSSQNPKTAVANDPESCFKPMYEWWNEYATTKVLPVSQLKAKTVTLGDVPTEMSIGNTYSLKLKAEFTNGMTWNVAGDAAYTVSDPSVLTITNGNIRVQKEGTCTVDVRYTDGTGQEFDRQFQIEANGSPTTTRVYADSKVAWYGDEIPALTFTTLNTNLSGTPQLAVTATSGSPVGAYPITIGQGTISDPDVEFVDARLYIFPKPLDASLKDVTVSEGEMPGLSFAYSGFRDGDSEGNALTKKPVVLVTYERNPFYATRLNGHLPAGTYFITGRDGEAQNYELCYNVAKLTVEEASIKGTNLTARVGTSQDSWHASGMTDTHFAPSVTTGDGRTSQMAETYEGTAETTGELMWQEIEGLPNGDYVVELFANAVYTPNRGFESSVTEGADDVVYIEANGQRTYLGARIGEAMPWNEFYSVNTTVTNGTLRISMVAEKPGTNWHTIQVKRLIKLAETTVTADDKTMAYGDEVPELTYTVTGPALDGTPRLTTTATSTSPVGTYPITVERGTETNERTVYVAGTLTITKAPLTVGVKDATITEGDALPTFTLTYDCLRCGDTEATAFTTKPQATTTATAASAPGEYPITVSGGKAKNYELSYTGGTLTIEANPLPQDEDLTARVGTSQDNWHAQGVCATEYAPAITTNDGRRAQMMETYEVTVETTGEMMYQAISGLESGDYAVELYANAQYTDGRGFASDLKDGATDVVYVSANGRRTYITAHVGTAVSENGVYTVYAHVSDGTLRIGLTAEKAGTNWHTLQIKKLVLLRVGTVVYADDKTREQGEANPQWSFTASGADITGRPTQGCSANKQSAPGCYVIRIKNGTLKSELPIYLQPGVLTVTVPTGIENVEAQETDCPVYDLQGRKVQGALKPGLYIRDGKVVRRN